MVQDGGKKTKQNWAIVIVYLIIISYLCIDQLFYGYRELSLSRAFIDMNHQEEQELNVT